MRIMLFLGSMLLGLTMVACGDKDEDTAAEEAEVEDTAAEEEAEEEESEESEEAE
tara:strand:- start:420 stop:584 length:165 start_codon:yes stop_codon:yes gene_type:complete